MVIDNWLCNMTMPPTELQFGITLDFWALLWMSNLGIYKPTRAIRMTRIMGNLNCDQAWVFGEIS